MQLSEGFGITHGGTAGSEHQNGAMPSQKEAKRTRGKCHAACKREIF